MDIDRYRQIIADFAAREETDPGCPEMWERASQLTATRFAYVYDGLVTMGQEFHADGRVTEFPDAPMDMVDDWSEDPRHVLQFESVDAWIAKTRAEIDQWNEAMAPFRKGA